MLSLIVHGGAWDIPAAELDAHREGVSAALATGWELLKQGANADDVVVATIRSLEENETFDAGRGSHLNAVGQVELDASIMNGRTMRCGAIAGVHRVRNPIELARKIMDSSEHVLLVGDGAERFADQNGIPLCSCDDLIIDREWSRWSMLQGKENYSTKESFRRFNLSSDTVGAVAMDRSGTICAGTSTGGTLNKYPGRVGDSPLIGCGTYADMAVGGVSTTGWGEAIIKVVLAKTVIDRLEINGGDPRQAAEAGIDILHRKVDGFGGVIVMNKKGEFGIAHNTPRMARAFINESMTTPVAIV
jgi:L-asparaginase / beta-aspartyl-peptidase